MSAEPSFAREPRRTLVDGVRTPAAFGSVADEVRAIRTCAALGWRPDIARFRLSGSGAWELLGRVCPADIYLRDGQLRHTLLLDERGHPVVDLLVGNDDDSFLLFGEGLPAAALREHLVRHAPPGLAFELDDLGTSHAYLTLDGPFAWEVLGKLEGPDVAGFPLLTCYRPRPDTTYLRAGKTGEYGYGLLVPHAEAAALWLRLLEAGAALDLREVGIEASWHASLESWFFNIHAEGLAAELTPHELQLHWRLSHEERDYVGAAALRARRPTRRTTALVGRAPLAPGAVVRYQDRPVGSVLVTATSVTLGLPIAIALVERELAHSGIDRFVAGDVPVRTVSPPFVDNLSLYVSAQRHSWSTRHELDYPGPRRPGIAPP